MKGKAYEEKTVAYIMFRILQSIDYIHSIGVLHRDIKVKKIDYKIARELNTQIKKGDSWCSNCRFWTSWFL